MRRVSAPASRDSIILPRRVLKGVQTNSGLYLVPSSIVRLVRAGGMTYLASRASSTIYLKAQLYSAYRGKDTLLTFASAITASPP